MPKCFESYVHLILFVILVMILILGPLEIQNEDTDRISFTTNSAPNMHAPDVMMMTLLSAVRPKPVTVRLHATDNVHESVVELLGP